MINLQITRIEALAVKVALKNEIKQTAIFLKRFKEDKDKTYFKNSLYLIKQKVNVLRKLKQELNK